ncbi:hypothetical protein [Saccharothrix algeriensis]|uniref:Uncharacterized protein n=1 Tax=Saccharothrix algeriensis TaxID=173560 RepID=A0A8T8I520_9PSEU|nr:hypothetical protein [Saccharothrix algeriensis]MBM7811970.1 hypothetical protein [Saccharothrix algeriensis]QTR05668.1 hypothetical protein J7S33_14580 [Saccharothrix algeriensis]
MNRTQVAALLRAASAVDPRLPAPDATALDAWAALLDDVPPEVAADALRDHYRRHTETIMPADVVRHWRAALRGADRPGPPRRRSYLLVLPDACLPPADLRAATADLARATGVPPLGRCSIRLRRTAPDGRAGDPERLVASTRACAEGLVDAGVAALVVQRTPEAGTGPRHALVLVVKPGVGCDAGWPLSRPRP